MVAATGWLQRAECFQLWLLLLLLLLLVLLGFAGW
jgi:hypothetical protein